MGHLGDFDPISSGIFDIATANPRVDFDVRYKVLKEVYEELCGGKDVEQQISAFDHDFFFRKPAIADIRNMIEDGRASFRVTGLCIDLVRIVPEITTVLVVRDRSFYDRYLSTFIVNLEYGAPSHYCTVPRAISNVDDYLAREFPADPATGTGSGFDPFRWTLPGGFCFYQGVKGAIDNHLL